MLSSGTLSVAKLLWRDWKQIAVLTRTLHSLVRKRLPCLSRGEPIQVRERKVKAKEEGKGPKARDHAVPVQHPVMIPIRIPTQFPAKAKGKAEAKVGTESKGKAGVSSKDKGRVATLNHLLRIPRTNFAGSIRKDHAEMGRGADLDMNPLLFP